MARGNILRAELVRALEQCAELQMFVAQDARVGGASGPVFSGKVADDLSLEFLRVINQMKRDAQVVADGAHISRRPGPAALEQVLVGRKTVVLPELERDADDVIALLDQQRRRGGGVHPPAHAADDALTLLRIHKAANIRHGCLV